MTKTILNLGFLKIVDDTKPDTRIRRTNGQIARRIPVKEMGKVIYYIYR